MKKQRTAWSFLAALLCVMLGACAAKAPALEQEADTEPPAVYEAFPAGNFAYIQSYEASPDACKTQLSVTEHNGATALFVDVSSGGVPYLAIDVSSLLGGAVSSLRTIELDIEVDTSNGEFYAVSGTLTPLSGEELIRGTAAPWSVYIAAKNPNVARATLSDASEYMVFDEYNMFIFTMDVDNAVSAGLPPTSFYILDLRFYDENESFLVADFNAGFNAPEGFGQSDRGGLIELSGEVIVEGGAGSSPGGWGQAVAIPTVHGGGGFDASIIVPGSVITVYTAASEAPPELILQSWSGGEGWAKVSPTCQNESGSIYQFNYDDIVAAFNSDDIAGLLDQIFVGDTGEALEVFSITVGMT